MPNIILYVPTKLEKDSLDKYAKNISELREQKAIAQGHIQQMKVAVDVIQARPEYTQWQASEQDAFFKNYLASHDMQWANDYLNWDNPLVVTYSGGTFGLNPYYHYELLVTNVENVYNAIVKALDENQKAYDNLVAILDKKNLDLIKAQQGTAIADSQYQTAQTNLAITKANQLLEATKSKNFPLYLFGGLAFFLLAGWAYKQL